MQRLLDLSPGYQHGGPEMFFGIYYAVQPVGQGRDLEIMGDIQPGDRVVIRGNERLQAGQQVRLME